MPLYEYQCGQCGRFELIQKLSDPVLAQCPTCGGEVHKLLSAPAIQFKGTGWYVTDYARKGTGGESKPKGSTSSSSDSTSKGSTESASTSTTSTSSSTNKTS